MKAGLKPPGYRPDHPPHHPPREPVDDHYTPPPPFPTATPQSPPASSTGLNPQCEQRRAKLHALPREDLVDRLLAAEARLSKWQSAASDFVTVLALSPEMTEGFYARQLRELLSAALLTLESVHALRHVESSMPCLPAEAPHVAMRDWRGLAYSEWRIDWAPHSWWVSVSADGSRWGLAFNALTRVSKIRLAGILRCAFSHDLTSVRISFASKPRLDMYIESSVGWGVVPLPVRLQMERMVHAEIESFVESRLTGDESLTVLLRTKAFATLSEIDVLEATNQARRASNVNLRSPLLL